MKKGYAINPQTSRIIKKSTAKYKRLLKLGLIVENEPTPETKVEPEKIEPTPEKVPEPEPVSLKSELAKTAVRVIEKNKDAFRDLNKEDTAALLRKLLIDKLCPKKTKEPKKSKKFKLKPPPPSSESESSDSN